MAPFDFIKGFKFDQAKINERYKDMNRDMFNDVVKVLMEDLSAARDQYRYVELGCGPDPAHLCMVFVLDHDNDEAALNKRPMPKCEVLEPARCLLVPRV